MTTAAAAAEPVVDPWARQAAMITAEGTFQRLLHDLMDSRYPSLKYFHSGDGRRDHQPGFPDLVIAGPRGVIYRELKIDSRLTAVQMGWRDALREAGQDWAIWSPDDVVSGKVYADLARIR